MRLEVGVKLIIQHTDGRVLLIKRRGHRSLEGIWDIPGGRIDPKESLLDGLRREVSEEIGAEYSAEPELLMAQDIFTDNAHIVRMTFVVRENIQVGRLSDEHSEHRLVALNETDGLDIEPFLRQALVKMRQKHGEL